MRFHICGRLPAALLAMSITFPNVSHAADVQERTLKFGYSTFEAHPLGQGANKFVALVSEKSDGKIKMKVYPATQLGSETQTISATQGGVQDLVGTSTAPLVGLVKEYAIFDLPFLLSNEKQADALVDGPVGQELLAKLQEKNLVGLCFFENGFRHVTNSKHPIVGAGDLSGLKIRVMQNPVYIDAFRTLGANAVPMPWPEVYTALESGAIDAQENPFGIIYVNKLNEVQKYVSVTKHAYSPWAVMMSKKLWDKLSADEQKIFVDSCNEAKAYQRQVSRAEDARIVAELKARGMQINELSPAELADLKARMQPVVAKYTETVGPDLVKQAQASIAAAP
ncbi:TRAP transporter substrate-binding protein [Ancylobacter lacus]|uniref:TRAP transporter substrate-binding protein n=1 Tax=Ancylobacter lacus TaxID=2579970 RepID=UPI001FECC1D1|nr:TRAP transporter substrate-binding protein [Ancylobacter lacus]